MSPADCWRSSTRAVFAIIFVWIGSCAASGDTVVEKLDPLTAVTITTAEVPMVFYRDNSGRAAYARDFVDLGPLQVNTSGRYRYFLWAGIWSTGQEANDAERRDGFENLVLFVDGEPLQLNVAGWLPDAIGASEPVYPKPVATAADAYYEVTIDMIRLIVNARDLRLQTGGPRPAVYEPWNDQQGARRSLRAFFDWLAE